MEIYLGLLVIAISMYFIMKGKYPVVVFLTGGMVLFLMSFLMAGKKTVLIKGAKATHFILFDLFSSISQVFSSTMGNLGLYIMIMVGFASYMSAIGANHAFVRLAIKPVSKVSSPYAVMVLAMIMGKFIGLVIGSATGQAVLCMVLMGPLLIRVGLSPGSIAAIFAISQAPTLSLFGSTSAAAAEALNMDVVAYAIEHKIPLGLPVWGVFLATHFLWQQYCDKKMGWVVKDHVGDTMTFDDSEVKTDSDAPNFYAWMPFIPLIMAFVFSDYGIKGIKIDVVPLILISIAMTFIVEIFYKDFNTACDNLKSVFNGMGNSFKNIVMLIISAAYFAKGVQAVGMVDALVHALSGFHQADLIVSVVFTGLVIIFVIVTGTSSGSYFPLIKLVPEVCAKLGVNPLKVVLPMHQSTAAARAISPVAGVVIAMAQMAKVPISEIIQRNWVPVFMTIGSQMLMVFMFR